MQQHSTGSRTLKVLGAIALVGAILSSWVWDPLSVWLQVNQPSNPPTITTSEPNAPTAPKASHELATTNVARPEPSTAEVEFEYWTSVKSSPRVRDFEEFLNKFPDGQFAGAARAKIASLSAPAVKAPSLPIAGSAVLAGDGTARPAIDPDLLPDEPPSYELPHGQVSNDISQNPAPRPVIVP